MIDAENEILSTVATALRTAFPGIYVTSEHAATPPQFPAVMLVEMDNSVYVGSLDGSGAENHAVIMYQADVYSDLASGRKAQCKDIMSALDTEMQKLGFIRTGSGPLVIQGGDGSLYRMVARYRATISKNKKIYRRQ
jgi:hypothetical protein